MMRHLLLKSTLILAAGSVMASCSNLIEHESDESLPYSVNISDDLRDSCLGAGLNSVDLPFPISNETVDYQDYKSAGGGQIVLISYRCSWEVDEEAFGKTYLPVSLSVSVSDSAAYAEFNLDDPNLSGEVVVDSLEGWDSGYCAVLSGTSTESEHLELGDMCAARSGNLELTVEVYREIEIDMEAFMEELTPIVQQAFAKG